MHHGPDWFDGYVPSPKRLRRWEDWQVEALGAFACALLGLAAALAVALWGRGT